MGYWTGPNGQNLLKGVPGDASNPPRLSDETIIFALQRSRQARVEFDLVFDALLPEEQDRLSTLVNDNPARSKLVRDSQDYLDDVQKRRNTETIRTVGPRGGKGVQTRPAGKVL